MDEIIDLKQRINVLEDRNLNVAGNKAWEISRMRIGVITLLILIASVLFTRMGDYPYHYLQALFPPLGYLFSTLSFSGPKNRWKATHTKEINAYYDAEKRGSSAPRGWW